MKKFLLLAILLMAAVPVNAIDWYYIDTNIPNLNLFIDKDSIKYINKQECVYAIKYQSGTGSEKVAYIKSNSYDNYIGVIQAGLYDESEYHPKAVLENPHVFMKPVNGDSFLAYAHKFVSNVTSADTEKDTAFTPEQEIPVKAEKPVIRGLEETNNAEKPAAYVVKPTAFQQEIAAVNLKEYVDQVGASLAKNWQPPKSGRHTQSIIILTIASDGSLLNYKFAKSSGDQMTDRSIMSVVTQAVPYAKFPKLEKPADVMNLQFVFNYKLFKKSVI